MIFFLLSIPDKRCGQNGWSSGRLSRHGISKFLFEALRSLRYPKETSLRRTTAAANKCASLPLTSSFLSRFFTLSSIIYSSYFVTPTNISHNLDLLWPVQDISSIPVIPISLHFLFITYIKLQLQIYPFFY